MTYSERLKSNSFLTCILHSPWTIPGIYEILLCKHDGMKIKGIQVPDLITIYDSIFIIKMQAKDPGLASTASLFSVTVSAGSKMARNGISCKSRRGWNKNNAIQYIQKSFARAFTQAMWYSWKSIPLGDLGRGGERLKWEHVKEASETSGHLKTYSCRHLKWPSVSCSSFVFFCLTIWFSPHLTHTWFIFFLSLISTHFKWSYTAKYFVFY